MNKECQNCKTIFEVTAEDQQFYTKVGVPPPTWCPDCRQQRRYAWRNERTLYRRKCDLCGKSTVTIYSPNKPYKVYCPPCWWGDGWDARNFGRDFDFNRPFFEQFKELQLQVPRIALLGKNSTNSEYSNHSSDNKNCYLVTSCVESENIMYSNWIMGSRDTMDGLYVYDKLERSYECIDSRNSYRCQFGFWLRDCNECFYCYDCHGCTNCFLSTNLRNRSYCFLNQQYSKEEYLKKVAEFKLGSFADREKLYQKYLELMQAGALHRFVMNENSVNVVGSTVSNSRNAYRCFDVDDVENSRYCISALHFKDSMDSYHFGFKTELAYEAHALIRNYFTRFCHLSYDDSYITYCDTCHNSQNLFGCVGVNKGEYLVFNKQYSKEEYTALMEKIIEHMKKTKEFGEFFPIEMSPFGYNETQGNVYMPLTKEQVLAKGWKWEDTAPGTFGKETITAENLPDDIKDVGEEILSAVLKCISCSRNYNVVKPELDFYKRENVPIPRRCYDCRYMRRIKLRSPRNLWHRTCMCDYAAYPNTVKHPHHTDGTCPNEFETCYAPDRKEIVYCEQCYNAEVV